MFKKNRIKLDLPKHEVINKMSKHSFSNLDQEKAVNYQNSETYDYFSEFNNNFFKFTEYNPTKGGLCSTISGEVIDDAQGSEIVYCINLINKPGLRFFVKLVFYVISMYLISIIKEWTLLDILFLGVIIAAIVFIINIMRSKTDLKRFREFIYFVFSGNIIL